MAWGKLTDLSAPQKVMGEVFPQAPTFLGSDPIAGEGNLLFPGRIRIRFEDLAIHKSRFPLGFPTRHCCLASPQRGFTRNISISAKSLLLSLRPKAPVPLDGSESGSGFGLRLCLTLLPRSPCHFLPPRSSLRMSMAFVSGSSLALLPFPVGRSGCKWKLRLRAPSHNVNRPGDN